MKKNFALSILILIAFSAFCHAKIIHVQEGGTGTGTSWADAYGSLQDGLSAAVSSDLIKISQGTYKPGTLQTDSFRMKNGVIIQGAYAGFGAPDPDDRSIQLYETVLSGDINGDDGDNFVNYSDNCYHVFYHPNGTNLDETAILDGVTITAGNGNGADGGGMYNRGCSQRIMNCTFAKNAANYGGGIENYESSPQITGCKFTDNLAVFGGGGIENYKSDDTKITDSVFMDNSSYKGGGMYNFESSTTVTKCAFFGNNADNYGGGMANDRSSSPIVTNCSMYDNSAVSYGGGMYNGFDCAPIVTNCIIYGNAAGFFGGGMYNDDSYSDPIVTNCVFVGNEANFGGGMYNDSYSDPTVTNCILWGNTATSGSEIYGDTVLVSYSCVQGGHAGTDNIDADPKFVENPDDGGDGWGDDPGTPGVDEGANDDYGDLHLQQTSPCIDAGDDAAVPVDSADLDGDEDTAEPTPYDLDSRARSANGDCIGRTTVDMGAFEFNWLHLGDFTGDCDVNISDFLVLAEYWLENEPSIDIAPISHRDGIIDLGELSIMAKHWLARILLADFTKDGKVDYEDFAVLAESWQLDNPEIDVAPVGAPDGIIDIEELLVMSEQWLERIILADFTKDGRVDYEDFAVLAGSWQLDNPEIDVAPAGAPDGIIDLQELLVLANDWLLN